MKKLITLILLISLFKVGSSQDVHKENKKDKAKMFAIIGLTVAPNVLMFAGSHKEDKAGKIVFLSSAAVVVASSIGILANSERKKVLHYSLFFTAGMLDGFNEEITHHYPLVKDKLPGLNDQWFDPSISWKNKYTSNVPFATTLLVSTTDAYHASRTLNKVFVLGGIFTFDKPKTFKEGLLKTLGICVSYSAGKGLVHYIIQK